MRRADRSLLEDALREHYRSERARAARRVESERAHAAYPVESERVCAVYPAEYARKVAALAAAAASEGLPRASGFSGLAKAAARFSPRVLWAVPAAVVVLALALALSGASAREAEAALVASGPVLAAASLVGVVRARSCRMQELEASCVHNAVAVACARLGLFGGASLLALAAVCAACSAVVSAGAAAAYALAPYLLSAAGGLMLARRVSSGDAAIAAIAWSAGACALCLLLRVAVPEAYCDAAIWAWAAATAAGALWCAREAAAWVRLSVEGGCASARAAYPAVF